MKLFTCTDHDSHYPVGCASIIIAKNRAQAKKLLDQELIKNNLQPFDQYGYNLHEVNLNVAQAIVLVDGDY